MKINYIVFSSNTVIVVNHLISCHLLLYLNKTKHVGTINILKINRTMHLVIMTVLSRASAMSNI